jgi:hypothetical protein
LALPNLSALIPRTGCTALERLPESFRAWLADVTPREVVRSGLDRGDAATVVQKYSWIADRILQD